MIKQAEFPGSDSKPTFFYVWVMVISVSLVMMASGGSRGAFGVFFNPMANELGWSAAQISGTFTLSMLVEGVFSAIAGRLSDKFGTRIVLICGGIISASGFILMSLVNTTWQMYLIYGLITGIGIGGLFIPVVSLIAKQFSSRRSLINGIALAANGLGQLVSPLIAYQLIVVYQWRTSFIIQGIIVFVLVVLPTLFLKRHQPENKQLVQTIDTPREQLLKSGTYNFSFNEARKTSLFWMMIIMQGCYVYCLLSLLVHLVPYSIEIGIPAFIAANLLACIGAAMIVGRLGLGAIADKIGSRRTMLIGFVMLFISLIWLLMVKEVWSLFLFAIICGLGFGGVSSSQSPLAANYFGSKSHGSIFGAIGGATVIVGSTGPFITGYLFDLTGTYQTAFIACASLSLAGTMLCLLLKRPKKRPSN